MTPILEVSHLTKRFGALVVTDDLSIDLRSGECHALIGPNGAGKTTLIHQLSGTLRPDSGSIRFGGEDVTSASPHRRARLGLGRTFQITSTVPSLSILENVAIAAQARSGSSFRFFRAASRDRRLNGEAERALALVGVESGLDRPASALSHGEKRVVELATVIASRPRALLLDEPMAGMGRDESIALTETLRGLKAEYPLLLVEHDMDAVFALADRVSVLAGGAIIASGAPADVRADPAARSAYLGEDA